MNKGKYLNRRLVVISSLAVALCGGRAAMAEFTFIGGDPAVNTNGTNSNFFSTANVWLNGTSSYTPPTSGPDPNPGTTTMTTININTGVAGTGAVFDPASQDPNVLQTTFGMTGLTFNTNGKVYLSSNSGGPGTTSGTTTYAQAFPNNPYNSVEANYWDIESGEFHLNSANTTNSIMIIGRSGPGTLEINGGAMVVDTSIQVAGDGNNVDQTGSIIYNGGVLQAGLNPSTASSPGIRLGNGAAGTANLVVYNNGTGNITLGGLYLAKTASAGSQPTVATVEFHYDNDGTRPIQIHNSGDTAEIKIANGTGQQSRLNIVLDSSPTMTEINGVEVPQNLGLFSTDKVTGNDTTSEFFYDPTGTNLLTEGAAITERAPNGYTDTWDISYQGTINFSDPSNSVVSSVTGPNNLFGDTTEGTDIVLMGVSAIAPVIGDANGDGIVDGTDLGILQGNLGKSVAGGYAAADFNDDGMVNADDVAIYQFGLAEYNSGGHPVAPEPASAGAMLGVIGLMGLTRRRGRG